MANLRIFRNLFIQFAQTAIKKITEREKRTIFANLLEVLHRKTDSFFGNIQGLDLHAYAIPNRKCFAGMFKVFLTNFGYMNETVLMHTDIKKCTEIDHVADNARQNHTDAKVIDVQNIGM